MIISSDFVVTITIPLAFKNNKKLRTRQIEETTYKEGLRHTIFNTVNDKYIGEWKSDKKTGNGIMLTRFKDLYEGEFNDNYRHGFGVLASLIPKYNVFSLKYRGNWKNGKMEGRGMRVYGLDFYRGNFKNGKRHGYGQMWFECGAFYDGDWVDDHREGLGLLVYANGNRYEGSWSKDMKHGSGRFYFLNTGQLQTGVWRDDICVFSVMKNLPYRQAAKTPIVFPLLVNQLVEAEEIIERQEYMALEGIKEDCLRKSYASSRNLPKI